MKKILFSVLAIAMAAVTFTSCEDVPAPYDDPNDNPIDEPTVIEPEGDGTQASPYNVAATIALAEQLGQGDQTEEDVYIKGIVTDITENYDGGYGNATYSISDDADATNTFLIYRSRYFNNANYSSGQTINYGDTVVVCGKLTNYNGTLETAERNSYLISINGVTGETGGGDEPTTGEPEGDGTEANPFNAVAAYQYAAALGSSETAGPVYIKGIVSKIKENYDGGYGNATYWISDDGTFDSEDSGNQFYIFRSKYLNNESYSSGDLLSVGDEVVVYGTVTNYYGNTPETVQNDSYLYSWTKGDGGDEPGGGEDTGDPNASNGDFESWTGGQPNNWETTSSAGNATLSQSTDAHSGNYSVRVAGTSSSNKRISYKEITLQPGEYTMEFYVKAATASGASVRPGYAVVNEDGTISGGDAYKYGDYVNDISSTEWTKVAHTFTISTEGTYCVLIMNAKNPGKDVLIDDFVLMKGSIVIIK